MNDNNKSILYKEGPQILHLIVYFAILAFLVVSVHLLLSVEDLVEGWFEQGDTATDSKRMEWPFHNT